MRPIEDAVVEFFAGRLEVCLGSLQQNGSPDAAALRARALLRMRRYEAALEECLHGLRTDASHAQRGELTMLRATVLARLGRYDEAAAASDEARVFVFAASSAALEAEYFYFEAHRAFAQRDTAACQDACEAVFDTASPAFSEPRVSHRIPIGHSRALADELLGALAATRGDFAAQGRLLADALDEASGSPTRDAWLEARLVAGLSYFTREFGDEGGAALVRRHVDAIAWIPELAPQRYQVLRSLGWSGALRGDYLGAFRELRAAARIAPSLPLEVRAVLDRAYLARELRQGELLQREELEHAETLGREVDWSAQSDPDAVAVLVGLAEMLAPASTARARGWLALYRRSKERLGPHAFPNFDRRAFAEELIADAAIARAEGAERRATRLLVDAFEIWDACGYRWRAALAAADLADLGAGERFARYAAAEAAARPASWLAERLTRGSLAKVAN